VIRLILFTQAWERAMTTALLGITCWLGLTASEPAVSPTEFRSWFSAASHGRLRLPRETQRGARAFRYVFIGGLANEYLPGYFAQSAKELRALGVPRESIHFIHPSSVRSISENLDTVGKEMRQIEAKGPERLVVIAHSRGACDALAFALNNPEFVRRHVQAMFLIQGPFGGTGLADYLMGEGTPIDGQMPLVARFLAYQAGKLVQKSMSERGWKDSIADLTRENSSTYWKRSLREHAGAIDLVSPRVFFIESQARPGRLGWFHKVTGSYLRTYYGPNDGLIARDDQHLKGLGTSLGPIEAGHADLTCKFPVTAAGKRHRKALIQSIVMAVGQPGMSAQPAFASASQHSASSR
jgi:hypothetical protein